MTFNNFFFERKFGEVNKPLFKSQIQMATFFIEDILNPYYKKNSITTRSAISQVFCGERNVSKNLKIALERAIVFSLKESSLSDPIIAEFDQLMIKIKPVLKDWVLTKNERELSILKANAEMKEKLKYTYIPDTEITSDDLEYLLLVIKGSGNKICLGILMTLLKQRKNIE